MAKRPKIKITLIDRKGPCGCHRGHKIGDSLILIHSVVNYAYGDACSISLY